MLYQSMITDFIKTKIKTFGNKIYTNFRSIDVGEDDTDCESFTAI